MTTQFFPTLPQNYTKLLKDETYFDVGITVGKVPDTKLFHAHKLVLDKRSPYFTNLFQDNDNNNNNNNLTITLPDISPKIFEIILNYLYTGDLALDKLKTSDKLKASDIIEILVAAGKLGCHEIVPDLQSLLIERKSNWMERHFNFIHRVSLENNFSRLQDFCEDFIERSPESIFQLSDFNSIPESVLMSLVKKEDILLEEEDIWDHVLKWVLAKLPLPEDLKAWTTENMSLVKKEEEEDIWDHFLKWGLAKPEGLKAWITENIIQIESTLKQFLPHIRFSQLSSQQFYEKAHPYIFRLLPELDDQLLKFYLVPGTRSLHPPRLNEVNGSKIINNHQYFSHIFSYISKLINNEMIYPRELDYSQRIHYNPYELKLLLRGSRHGFSPGIFHKLCDNKPGTVTLIKVKGKDEILGGYNPGEWKNKNGYGSCKSFIFSLKDHFENISISHVDYNERALNYGKNYGPSFGLSDLIISGENFKHGRCYCKMDDYKLHIRTTENYFSVEDYEVFQIISKR